jgi:uncharacterized protein YjiS (DUF1127 family)
MTTAVWIARPQRATERLGRAVSHAAGALRRLADWSERARMRRELGRLDDRLLRDIGVDRASASYEADKPFWKP